MNKGIKIINRSTFPKSSFLGDVFMWKRSKFMELGVSMENLVDNWR